MTLNELYDNSTFITPAIAAELETKCSEIIQIYRDSHEMIYTGRTNSGEILHVPTIVNRRTRNVPLHIQQIVDNNLYKEGFTALRHNSLFCSGDYKQTHAYGSCYLVFPKNGFSFTWSPLIKDFFLDTLYDEPANVIKKIDSISAHDMVESLGFRHGTSNTPDLLQEAIGSEKEILIHGSSILITIDYISKLYDVLDL